MAARRIKKPGAVPARAHFLSFNFKIDESLGKINNISRCKGVAADSTGTAAATGAPKARQRACGGLGPDDADAGTCLAPFGATKPSPLPVFRNPILHAG